MASKVLADSIVIPLLVIANDVFAMTEIRDRAHGSRRIDKIPCEAAALTSVVTECSI